MPSWFAWLLFVCCLFLLLAVFLVFPLLVLMLLLFSINRHLIYHRRLTHGIF